MDPILEQFNKARKEIRLEPEQKTIIRNNLLRLVEADLATKPRLTSQPRHSIFAYFKNASVATMAIILLGTGTSFASENTLPGDILYPIKVAISEPVRSALSLSAEAKASWEAELANRRLNEAVKLAQAGKLDSETEASLSAEFEKHEENTQEKIAEFESEGKKEVAASLAARFEGSLKAHENALAETDDSDTATIAAASIGLETSTPITMSLKMSAESEPSNSIKTKIKNALAVTADTRMRLEEKIKSDNSSSTEREAEAKIETASKIIKRTQGLVKNKKGEAEDESSREDEVQLKASADLVTEAKTKSQAKLFGEAFNLANQALRDAQESKTSLELRIQKSKKRGGGSRKENQNATDTTSVAAPETTTTTSSIKIENSKSEGVEVETQSNLEEKNQENIEVRNRIDLNIGL